MKEFKHDPVKWTGIAASIFIIMVSIFYFVSHIMIPGMLPIASTILMVCIAIKYYRANQVEKTTVNIIALVCASLAALLNGAMGILQLLTVF